MVSMSLKKAQAKYAKSDKGKLAIARARHRYVNSAKGKLSIKRSKAKYYLRKKTERLIAKKIEKEAAKRRYNFSQVMRELRTKTL